MLIVALCQSSSCHLLDSPKQLLLLSQFTVCLTDGNGRASPLPPPLLSSPAPVSLLAAEFSRCCLQQGDVCAAGPRGLDKDPWKRAGEIISVIPQESSVFHSSLGWIWRWKGLSWSYFAFQISQALSRLKEMKSRSVFFLNPAQPDYV